MTTTISPLQPTSALFLNGVFEGVLSEILSAQESNPARDYYLQPYKSAKIRALADNPPSVTRPTRLYISTTDNLPYVAYRALVVGWDDKRAISEDRLALLNRDIATYQPGEVSIYPEVNGKACVNLLTIRELEALPAPMPVSMLLKTVDNSPLRPRTQSGGWVPVQLCPDWYGTLPFGGVQDDIESSFRCEVQESIAQGSVARHERLQTAPRLPERVQTIVLAFKRNADVAAEVLERAQGRCERCKSTAPFFRKTDGKPYLEVHHQIRLADGGEDVIENAIAVCPNCHRELHHG